MLLVGMKKWQAFVVLIVAESLWVAYSLQTKQYGFILGATAYIAVHLINIRRWRRDSSGNRTIRGQNLRVLPDN